MTREDVLSWFKRILCCMDADSIDEKDGDSKVDTVKSYLAEVAAFSSLNDQELWHLARLAENRSFHNKEVIIENEKDAGIVM